MRIPKLAPFLALVLSLGLVGASAEPQDARAVYDQTLGELKVVDSLRTEGRGEEALKILDEAIARPLQQSAMLAHLHCVRADVHRFLQQWDAVTADLDEAERLVANHPSPQAREFLECDIIMARGDAALDAGLTGVAARHYREAFARTEPMGEAYAPPPPHWFNGRWRLAKLWLAREDFEILDSRVTRWLEDPAYEQNEIAANALRAALGHALCELEDLDSGRPRRGEQILEAVLDGESTAIHRNAARLRQAEARLNAGDPDGARKWLDDKDEEDEKEGEKDSGDEGAGDDEPEVRISLLDQLYRAALESRTGRELEDRPEEHARQLQELLDAFVAQWRSRPPRKGGYGPLQYGHQVHAALDERIERHLELEPRDEALEASLRMANALHGLGSLARSLDATVPSLAEIRAEILTGDDGHGILFFLPGPRTSHLLLVGTDSLDHVRLAGDNTLRAARRQLVRHSALLGATAAPDERLGNLQWELGDLLLPPEAVSVVSTWERWTVCGIEILGETPFEDLRVAGLEGSLGEHAAICRLPSLSVGAALARRAGPPPPTLRVELLVANEPGPAARSLSSRVEELPVERDRLEEILAPYPARQRELWMDDEAGASRLVSIDEGAEDEGVEEDGETDVLQIIAHGIIDLSRELAMALALAPDEALPDGLFRPEHVEGARAPRLVVLTACRAAYGPERRGDATSSGFAGAFFQAGTQVVLSSPSDLELGAVLETSERLHEALGTGASPAETLQILRREAAAAERAIPTGLRVEGLGHRALVERRPGDRRGR